LSAPIKIVLLHNKLHRLTSCALTQEISKCIMVYHEYFNYCLRYEIS